VSTSDVINVLTFDFERESRTVFIRGHGMQVSMQQAMPQRLPVFFRLQRRISVILHAVGFLIVVGCEGDVIVQGLGNYAGKDKIPED
jgi:hypothetical protein